MSSTLKEPIYIIIPVHNRKNLTLECLENLSQCGDLQRYHVVVIDDGSTDGTTEAIDSLYPEVTVLAGDGNLWWTGAIKKGMEYAYKQGAEFFVWLNDDCRVSTTTINNLINFSQDNKEVIVGCQGVEANNPETVAFGGKVKSWGGYQIIKGSPNQIISCDIISGNLVCLPRYIIEKIGYPEPALTPHYGGDALFLIRARKVGFKIFVDTRTNVLNITSEQKLYPKHWFIEPGEPLKIFKLIFVHQSYLSWRIWLVLNWEAYSFWGLFLFLGNYAFILMIAALRFLPLPIRKKLSILWRENKKRTKNVFEIVSLNINF